MKKQMIIGILVLGLSLNLTACMGENKSAKNMLNYNEDSMLDVKCNTNSSFTVVAEKELVKLLIENAKKYFNVDIDENSFSYSIGKKVGFNSLEVLPKLDDLEDVYIVAHAKGDGGKSDVINVSMEYDIVKKKVESMKIATKKPYDKSAQISQQEAIDIAKKFISEKKLVPDNTQLALSKFVLLNGYSFIEFKYIVNGDDEEIEIVIDNTNKMVTMFELD